MRGTLSLVLAAAVLAGCALRPGPPGSEVRVIVMRPLLEVDLRRDRQWRSEAEQLRDAASGLAALVGQRRVVVTRCALSGFEVVFHLAVLPPGMAMPAEGALLRVRLGDAATADAVLGPLDAAAGLTRGTIVTVEPGEEALVRRHYYKIRSAFLLACTARS